MASAVTEEEENGAGCGGRTGAVIAGTLLLACGGFVDHGLLDGGNEPKRSAALTVVVAYEAVGKGPVEIFSRDRDRDRDRERSWNQDRDRTGDPTRRTGCRPAPRAHHPGADRGRSALRGGRGGGLYPRGPRHAPACPTAKTEPAQER